MLRVSASRARAEALRPLSRLHWAQGPAATAIRGRVVLPDTRLFSASSPGVVDTAAHPGFDLIRNEHVAEHAAWARIYRHRGTGAEVLSVVSAETEKVFGALFSTPPTADHGVAHILEHSVLCGSARYPCKEPFVELLRSSLQTFLNAMTYPDRTVYPVASLNVADFHNLVRVYLDAVLNPRLEKWVHAQEGWHLEVNDAQTNGTPQLSYKGVVYNEMQGVFSSADNVHGMACEASLFPDTTYSRCSGGDPAVIPSLTYEDFKEFHRRHYNANAGRFFFFGDDPEADRLAIMAEFLDPFSSAQQPASARQHAVGKQAPFAAPITVVQPYPVSAADQADSAAPVAAGSDATAQRVPLPAAGGRDEHYVTLNWCLPLDSLAAQTEKSTTHSGTDADAPIVVGAARMSQQSARLGVAVLNHLLVGNQTATLRKALIDSHLGSSMTGGGLEDGLLQPIFSAGLKGVKHESIKAVEELVLHTLAATADAGFDPQHVEASINTLEFQLREFATGGSPRGLSLFLGVAPAWLYGRDIVQELRYAGPLAELKAAIAAEPKLFSLMIRSLFVDNTHRSTVISYPDPQMLVRRERAESDRLAQLASSLTPLQLEAIKVEQEALLKRQSTPDPPEARATIPRLSIADLPTTSAAPAPRLMKPLTASHGSHSHTITSLIHEQPTNGIAYARLYFDLSLLPARLLPLLPLFAWCLTSCGTKHHDETSFARLLGVHTGGISAKVRALDMPGQPLLTIPRLFVQGKALADRSDRLGELLGESLLHARLDSKNRIMSRLRDSIAQHESSLISSGHSYASSVLSAYYSRTGWLNEMWGGLTALQVNRGLLRRVTTGQDGGFDAIVADLEAIRETLLTTQTVLPALTGDAATLCAAEPALASLLSALPHGKHRSAKTVAARANGAAWLWPGSPGKHATNPDAAAAAAGIGLAQWPFEAAASGAEDATAAAVPPPDRKVGIVVPTDVNYVAKSARITASYPASHGRLPGGAEVVSNVLRSGYLWQRVRVQGGAYGGFCSLNPHAGTLTYASYRDPALAATLSVFDGAAAHLRELDTTAGSEVEQAVIATIGSLDAPQSPAERADTSTHRYLVGITQADVQKRRDEVLAAGSADVAAFAAAAETAAADGRVCVVASEAALAEAASKDAPGSWLLLRPLQTE